jgi:hypothetical protein
MKLLDALHELIKETHGGHPNHMALRQLENEITKGIPKGRSQAYIVPAAMTKHAWVVLITPTEDGYYQTEIIPAINAQHLYWSGQ